MTTTFFNVTFQIALLLFQGSEHCDQIIYLNGFSSLVQFLLGASGETKRRWSAVQAQEFGPLHATIAVIIRSCFKKSDTTKEDKGLF